ncbi:hypothetical protein NQ318_010516 [Aromia moschata]|uniref:Cytochrome P450 n=1 Tax=Aromia moschata TaxID=1265417 RepID=A0AAV8YFB3_9CUCU|nr:hypothetical protein NQ318_010516 [Aromia moschata]
MFEATLDPASKQYASLQLSIKPKSKEANGHRPKNSVFFVCTQLFVLPLVLILYFLSGLAKFLKSKLILRRIPCPPCHWLLGNLTADLWHKPDHQRDWGKILHLFLFSNDRQSMSLLGKHLQGSSWAANCVCDLKFRCTLCGWRGLRQHSTPKNGRLNDIYKRVRSSIQGASDRMKDTIPVKLQSSWEDLYEVITRINDSSLPNPEVTKRETKGGPLQLFVDTENLGPLFLTPKINLLDELFCIIRKNSREYWPIYRFEAFHMTTVNFLHPCDIEIILSSMIHMRKSGIYSMLKRWLGEGLLTSTGKKWQTRRKILTPAFHFNILQEFLKVFNEETEKLVKQIEENCKEPFIDVVPIITQMTLQSIGETAMGLGQIDKATQEKYKDSIFKIAQLILTQITRPWYRVPYVYCFSKLKEEELKTTEYLHSFAYRVIRNRENVLSKVYNDDFKNNEKVSYSRRKVVRMLDLLLMSKMGGSDIDLEGIREEVDTFMFEGHDTTSMAITYLLLLLANNQDIQGTVAQEITNVVGTGTPTYDDLQELKYTERVIKEALRLYPSVPFISRVAGEDFTTYTGYFIPKGTVLNIHIYDLHRDPEVYPDPEKFDPDRFLPENCKRHPFAYIPFSAGPRNCIGQRYAILELKAVLCGILRKFFMEPVDKPSDMSFHCDMVLRPRTAVRIKFVPK